MSFRTNANCLTDNGNCGDPKSADVCVDYQVDQAERCQLPELSTIAAKEAKLATSVQQMSLSSPVKKYTKPQPVNHGKAFNDFLHLHRERIPNVVASELSFFKREIALQEISKKQLQKYMLATDEAKEVDLKEWGRYEIGLPKRVPPTHDVNEIAERAAQLKLYCRWRKRVIQKRVEIRRQQLEAEHLALTKKNTGILVPLLSRRSIWGSSKTVVEGISSVAAKQAPTDANKRRKP
ncbi:hypothetical protein Plhal304r1_c009g0037201 [Plasmopara halstedii]